MAMSRSFPENAVTREAAVDSALGDLADVAAHLCQSATGLVVVRTTGRVTTRARSGAAVLDFPNDSRFWQVAETADGSFEINDVRVHPQLANSCYVTQVGGVRYYAGMYLRDGICELLLCVLDDHPHQLDPHSRQTLEQLAKLAMLQVQQEYHLANARVAERQLQAVFDHAPVAHLLLGPSGVMECNSAARQLYEIQQKEKMIGRPLMDWSNELQPDGRASWAKWREIEAAARQTGHSQCEWQFRRATGDVFWADVVVTVCGNDTLLVTVHDLTSQRLTEAALRDSESRYRMVIDTVRDVLFQVDRQGHWTLLNAAWSDLTGCPVEESLGRPMFDAVHAGDRDLFARRYHEFVVEDDDELRMDVRLMDVRGACRWVQIICRQIRDEAGAQQAVAGVLNDITERRTAEEALGRSQELFNCAFNESPIGLAMVAPTGHFLHVNHTLCEMLGYMPMDLLECDWEKLTYADDRDLDVEPMQRMLRGDMTRYQVEKRLLQRSGRAFRARLSVSLVRQADHTPLYFIAQVENISEYRSLQEEQRK